MYLDRSSRSRAIRITSILGFLSTRLVRDGLLAIVFFLSPSLAIPALADDGFGWGTNDRGQLGNGFNNSTNISTVSPVPVNTMTGLTGVRAIAAGHRHSLALMVDGTVWSW